ncbi:MAG: MarR family transcriptional regulator [Proteobacteria bacterium]|nr:MarR family transcriptional regulator [Pseudomonadota bacterium]
MTGTEAIAVLTGDLVNSAGLGPEGIARAFRALAACAQDQAGWMGAPLHFSRHRGDGWQVVLARPGLALRSGLAFRAALRALGEEFDSYVSIAEGPAPAAIAPDLNRQTEGVFTLSGRGLDEMKSGRPGLRMAHAAGGPLGAAAILADRLAQGWTPAQAQAILPALDPGHDLTHAAIARSLGKSRQAVTKSLHSAGHEALAQALATLEQGARR